MDKEKKNIHPNAPAVAGGPGAFGSAQPLGTNPDMDKWFHPSPIGIKPPTNSSAKVKWRQLTTGEIHMASALFRDSIDYSKVRVHNEEYFPFGLQDDDTAVTPNGEMYFNPKHFKSDFSMESDSNKLWFIHEMGHVWQYQLGYNVKWAGITTDYSDKKTYEYDIKTDAGKTLADFNFEQQCEIFKDYYAAQFLGIDPILDKKHFLGNVLHVILENPSNRVVSRAKHL